MNWFRENRFLGWFLAVGSLALIATIWFLLGAKGDWNDAAARFRNARTELNRLERLAPYPNEQNLRKMKAHAQDYSSALGKLKEELRTRVVAAPPMAPNEFQSRLRLALNAVADKARVNKVRLPDKFFLGFDDFVSSLPSEAAAPSLGQELVEIEWLLNSMLEAHVDAVTAFHRAPLLEERNAAATETDPTPATAGSKLFQRNVVDASFVSTAGAARKVINQIAGARQHFCIIRLLHVHGEKDKGPPRESAGETTAAGLPSPSPAAKGSGALNFIVGNEKIETTAKIEIVRFTL